MAGKLRVACYGVNGHQILWQLRAHPRAELAAVAEIGAEAVRQAVGVEAASQVRIEPDLDALIALPDVELISLCSPRRDEQFEHALRCLRGGKHVLAEKPAAMTVQQVEELQRVVSQCRARFRQMGSCGREAILTAIRKVVDSGRLGQVVQVVAQKSYPYHDGRPQDRGVDGGIIRQAGIHGIRFIQWATGLKAVRVRGFDTGCGNPKDGRLQMAASVALQLEGGALGVLICNYCNPKGTGYWGNEMLHIHGTGGLIELSEGFTRARMVIGSRLPEPIQEIPASFPDFLDSYVDHLLDGTPMPYSLEDDFYALRTVNRAQEAADKGCTLAV